jgi:hypothetical protein
MIYQDANLVKRCGTPGQGELAMEDVPRWCLLMRFLSYTGVAGLYFGQISISPIVTQDFVSRASCRRRWVSHKLMRESLSIII